MLAPEATLDLGSLRGVAQETVLPRPRDRWSFARLKPAVDFTLALLLLVLMGPALLVLALIIRLTSGGPAFYSQWRVGRRGKPYRMYKLRTMRDDAEDESGPVWATENDPRVTRFGSFLRVSHLDELPQLVNVLKGEMSLVGPRPERPPFVRDFVRSLPLYAARLEVRPGITGLAQVRQGYDTCMQDVRRKLTYDLLYIRRMCWDVDLRILVATVGKVLESFTPRAYR